MSFSVIFKETVHIFAVKSNLDYVLFALLTSEPSHCIRGRITICHFLLTSVPQLQYGENNTCLTGLFVRIVSTVDNTREAVYTFKKHFVNAKYFGYELFSYKSTLFAKP